MAFEISTNITLCLHHATNKQREVRYYSVHVKNKSGNKCYVYNLVYHRLFYSYSLNLLIFCDYVRNTWQYSNIMSFIVDEDIKCFEKTQVITAVSF